MADLIDKVPFTAEEEIHADLADGRTIVVAMPGQEVTAKLLTELGVTPLRRRVDEPSEHSPLSDLEAARQTDEAVADGEAEPANERHRRLAGNPTVHDHVEHRGVRLRAASETKPEADPEAEGETSSADEAKQARTAGGERPRTAKTPAPSK